MNDFKYILLVMILWASMNVNAQSELDSLIKIESGSYALLDALSEIKNSGVPLAYSSDKLPNVKIRVSKKETLREFLNRLQDDKILNYSFENSQMLINKYQLRRFTINGQVKNSESGEHLIGATIQIDGTKLGTTTNGYGYFSITLPEGKYEIIVSHIGYKSYRTKIDLKRNTYFSFSVSPNVFLLDEIEISSLSSDINLTSNIPSINRLNISQKSGQIPYLLGEVDIIQNALLRPGIKVIGEDATGLHIRGGKVDQNLILLDEAPIYNPNHAALVSVFNPEAVNDVKIFKGFIPPAYGGRTSSVMEVRQREGNKNKTSYSGGIGFIAARFLAEGPIIKGKSSYLASVRQSLLNPSIESFANTSVRRERIRFQDVNVKVNAVPNDRNTYYLSGYFGNDRNAAGFNTIRNWGNRAINFRWNHLYTPKVFSNLSAYISEYTYKVESAEEPGAFVSRSRIIDYSIKSDLTYAFDPLNEIKFGFSTIFHRLKPGDREPFDIDANTNTIRLDPEHALEHAVYLGQKSETGNLRFNYGFRYSALMNIGPEDVRIYESDLAPSDSTIIDTVSFSKYDVIKFYHNIEPRIAVNWRINENSSLKASYSKTVQYLHLISNTLAPSPTDTWKISDTYVPPTTSHQYSIGLYKNFNRHMWESSIEVYYKKILKDLNYRNGADLVFNENIETELLINQGRAYGLEFYLEKKYGNITGWVSYSWSRTESKLEEGNQKEFILNSFDKTHDFSTTWLMRISERLTASGTFQYTTGIPVTLPSDKYIFEGNLVPHFTNRNESRLPSYNRLDLSLKWEAKSLKKDGSKRKNDDFWVLTLYNVYARKNVNSYFFRESSTNPGFGEIVQYSIFGTIVPAITYNFKF